MAPINLTDIIGDLDPTHPVSIARSDSLQEEVPFWRDPIYITAFVIGVLVCIAMLWLLTFILIRLRREQLRRKRIRNERECAIWAAGLEHGQRSSDDDAMIMANGVVYHYNYTRKQYEVATPPGTPHLQSTSGDSVREPTPRLLKRKIMGWFSMNP